MLVPYFVAMNRTVLTVVLVAALFTGGALIFVWYVSFGMGRPSDGVVTSASIQQPANLSYYKDGRVSISAASEVDGQALLDHGLRLREGQSVADFVAEIGEMDAQVLYIPWPSAEPPPEGMRIPIDDVLKAGGIGSTLTQQSVIGLSRTVTNRLNVYDLGALGLDQYGFVSFATNIKPADCGG